jgi:hypothetical protein
MRLASRARVAVGACVIFGATASAFATNLNVRVQSGGSSAVTVPPGAVVNWTVVGELSDNVNAGLALFSVDLAWTGGPLTQAVNPTSGPMLNFTRPAGLTNPPGVNNPNGFGGTVVSGTLRQVGGAQNTIKNTLAPFPNGSVVTGIAAAGAPVTLANGQLTAPVTPGTYTLSASGLVANVIRQGDTGNPFWHVDKANAGTVQSLVVQVSSTATIRRRER